jgi:cell division protein FtsL
MPTSPSSPPPPRRARRIVFVLVAIALGMSIVYPLRQYHASKERLAALVREEQDVNRQIADLERQKQRLASDAEVERLARDHLHMVRPGEIAFSATGAMSTPSAAPATKNARPAKHGRPWYDAFWHWLAG